MTTGSCTRTWTAVGQLIPNSRLLLLNRCGHWAQVEHPEEFDRVVAGFIGRIL